MTYDVDIVFCIDSTGSMGPVIEEVKRKALRFPGDLLSKMVDEGKNVTQLRIKVVAYKDVFHDDHPFQISPFFAMPDDAKDFKYFMDGIEAEGGGDEPESGLEAVALAMESDWCSTATKNRHLIVVWTDASSHPIESGVGSVPPGYAEFVPASFGDLSDRWHGSQESRMHPKARRMVVFGPDDYPWTDISADWDETVHLPSKAGDGLAEFEYAEILELIVKSV